MTDPTEPQVGRLLAGGAEADVQTIAVAPSAQRGGVGTVLLTALLAEAVRRRAAAVLPGVRVRRLLFWRYLLVWRRPG